MREGSRRAHGLYQPDPSVLGDSAWSFPRVRGLRAVLSDVIEDAAMSSAGWRAWSCSVRSALARARRALRWCDQQVGQHVRAASPPTCGEAYRHRRTRCLCFTASVGDFGSSRAAPSSAPAGHRAAQNSSGGKPAWAHHQAATTTCNVADQGAKLR